SATVLSHSLHHSITFPFTTSFLRHSSTTFFFLTHPATTEIYTLSLHDALPISGRQRDEQRRDVVILAVTVHGHDGGGRFAVDKADRKSTRLNSSHVAISYAVFCLKKKKKNKHKQILDTYNTTKSRSF